MLTTFVADSSAFSPPKIVNEETALKELLQLPVELLFIIMLYVGDINTLSLTCKLFLYLGRDEILWKNKFALYYPNEFAKAQLNHTLSSQLNKNPHIKLHTWKNLFYSQINSYAIVKEPESSSFRLTLLTDFPTKVLGENFHRIMDYFDAISINDLTDTYDKSVQLTGAATNIFIFEFKMPFSILHHAIETKNLFALLKTLTAIHHPRFEKEKKYVLYKFHDRQRDTMPFSINLEHCFKYVRANNKTEIENFIWDIQQFYTKTNFDLVLLNMPNDTNKYMIEMLDKFNQFIKCYRDNDFVCIDFTLIKDLICFSHHKVNSQAKLFQYAATFFSMLIQPHIFKAIQMGTTFIDLLIKHCLQYKQEVTCSDIDLFQSLHHYAAFHALTDGTLPIEKMLPTPLKTANFLQTIKLFFSATQPLDIPGNRTILLEHLLREHNILALRNKIVTVSTILKMANVNLDATLKFLENPRPEIFQDPAKIKLLFNIAKQYHSKIMTDPRLDGFRLRDIFSLLLNKPFYFNRLVNQDNLHNEEAFFSALHELYIDNHVRGCVLA